MRTIAELLNSPGNIRRISLMLDSTKKGPLASSQTVSIDLSRQKYKKACGQIKDRCADGSPE